MALTAHQQEILGAIDSGISFLIQTHPDREKFSMKEIFTAAGEEIQTNQIYQIIKNLNRTKDYNSLRKIEAVFARANAVPVPLREALKEESKPVEASMHEPAERQEYFQSELFPENCDAVIDIPEPSSNTPTYRQVIRPDFDQEILALQSILKTLVPFMKDVRASMLESAASFYGIGR